MRNLTSSDLTLIRLDDALKRLIAGAPERTKADGKINVMRINDEAGLSRGNIYHYKDFIIKAKVEIELYNESINRTAISRNYDVKKSNEEKLRFERDKEKRLKSNYHDQAKNYRKLTDQLVRENASLAYRCMELSDELESINSNVIAFKK